MTTQIDRPPCYLAEAVYSNFDHLLDNEIVKQLREDSDCYAQHAAWDFCGYVWYEDGLWHEDVMIYHSLAEHLTDTDLLTLIRRVNDEYGYA